MFISILIHSNIHYKDHMHLLVQLGVVFSNPNLVCSPLKIMYKLFAKIFVYYYFFVAFFIEFQDTQAKAKADYSDKLKKDTIRKAIAERHARVERDPSSSETLLPHKNTPYRFYTPQQLLKKGKEQGLQQGFAQGLTAGENRILNSSSIVQNAFNVSSSVIIGDNISNPTYKIKMGLMEESLRNLNSEMVNEGKTHGHRHSDDALRMAVLNQNAGGWQSTM